MPENDYYKPSDDTFLLAECLQKFKGRYALEIGTGSGYICGLLKTHFKAVIATDINIDAIGQARDHVKDMKRDDGRPVKDVFFVCCDSSSTISNIKFDLIVMNPPYLPCNEIKDVTVDGGKDGIEVSLRMVKDSLRLLDTNGIMVIVASSLANYKRLMEEMRKLGLSTIIIGRKKLEFEEIMVLQATFRLRVLL